ASHEQEEDPLGFRGIVRGLRRHRVERRGRGRVGIRSGSGLAEQLLQGDGTQPDTALLEEPAPGDLARVGVAIQMVLAVHGEVSPPRGAWEFGTVAWAMIAAAQDWSSLRKRGWGGWR